MNTSFWHLWFAWRPVRTDTGWTWLQWAERREYLWGCGLYSELATEYRRAA